MRPLLSITGLSAFLFICIGAIVADREGHGQKSGDAGQARNGVRLLAVGDINLGRAAGQKILAGDLVHPFEFVRERLSAYDIVFGNLESQLSDQDGETQHPRNNLIFVGPPGGALSLKMGGITHVSTANNHALDYGVGALEETIYNLREQKIAFSGTALPGEDLYAPSIFTIREIRFALFSCTAVMNREDRFWTKHVVEADSGRLFPRIRSLRDSVDIILLSYHGGAEYSPEPSSATRSFAHAAVRSGVDIVLGHHPHVPQGIEEIDGKLIVYSLGNFVFYQPFAFWTQRGFALEAVISKNHAEAKISSYRLIPIVAATQPTFLDSQTGIIRVQKYLDSLSLQLNKGMLWPN